MCGALNAPARVFTRKRVHETAQIKRAFKKRGAALHLQVGANIEKKITIIEGVDVCLNGLDHMQVQNELNLAKQYRLKPKHILAVHCPTNICHCEKVIF